MVDSNEVIGNYNSGIAIDRGFNNLISNNQIVNNPYGIELWKGSNIAGYETQISKDYQITGNTLVANEIAVSSTTTPHMVIKNNEFNYNQQQSIYLAGTSATTDTATNNIFRLTTSYHIKNFTADDLYAHNNQFIPTDTALIREKIYDNFKNPTKGHVFWYPNTPGPPDIFQNDPPCDMAEPTSNWNAYADPGYGGLRVPEMLTFDSVEKKSGYASVKLVTGRGYDVALNYRPSGDSISHWTLTDTDTLFFWVRTLKNNYGFQYFSVRVGDAKGNYLKFTAPSNYLNLANQNWIRYKVPMTGGLGFSRTSSGSMYLENTNYVEIHADTWDYGFTIWVDGVQFSPCTPMTGLAPSPEKSTPDLQIYPNPLTGETTISFSVRSSGLVTIHLFDFMGKEIMKLFDGSLTAGNHTINLDGDDFGPGVYFVRMESENSTVIRKIIHL